MEPEQLLQRAAAINASVVCAPDVLYDSKGTIKEFKRFIKLKHEFGLVSEVMGIPQAANPTDWWECFQFMDLHPECALIGLSILSVPKAFARFADQSAPIASSRAYLIRQLYAFSHFSGHRITPCHMLGLGEDYRDIIAARKLLSRDVVSNDSSSAFIHGMQGIRYKKGGHIPGGKDHTPLDFSLPFDASVDHDSIQHNIDEALWIRKQDW